MFEVGKVRPPVSASYPLAEYAKAFEDLLERRVRGKVVLNP